MRLQNVLSIFHQKKNRKRKKNSNLPPPFFLPNTPSENAPLTFFQALKCLNLKGSFCFFLSGAFFSRLLKRCK